MLNKTEIIVYIIGYCDKYYTRQVYYIVCFATYFSCSLFHMLNVFAFGMKRWIFASALLNFRQFSSSIWDQGTSALPTTVIRESDSDSAKASTDKLCQ